MTDKPKFAMYWAAGCGGCEIAVLNTYEKILDIDANMEVVFWPVAMDAKYKDVEAMPDGSITLTLFNGAIRNNENEHLAHLLRQKSKILVAFGACASEGGIPALGNLSSKQAIIDTAFSTLTTDNGAHVRPQTTYHVPEGDLCIPEMYSIVRTLDQVVPVDYTMPGCPPEPRQIGAVVDVVLAALQGKAELPPAGSVIGAGASSVCDECTRTRSQAKIDRFRRIQDFEPDPKVCLLEQGILCSGSATRSGCKAMCPQAGSPCVGCYGPTEGALDQGARLMSAVASLIDNRDAKEIDRILDGIPDPSGVFYRFTMGGSLLRAARTAWDEKKG